VGEIGYRQRQLITSLSLWTFNITMKGENKMYQKITLVGNLGRDPELRYTPEGTPVASFSVATNRKWTNGDGSQSEETVWFRVTAWRRMAEVVNQYLSKGRQVFVEGRLRPDHETGGPRVYERNDGSHGASFEVTALTVKFLGNGHGAPADEPGTEIEEEGIPF
jgi:single-strand DNA-binding protein